MKKGKILLFLPTALLLTGCEINITTDDFTSKLIPNWVSFVTQLGALIVLLVVVFFLAYKPVKKIIKKRQDYIETNIKDSEESKAKWEANELKSQETVLASKREAQQIISDAKKEALLEKDKILAEATIETIKMKENAQQDIVKMEEEAKEEIRKEIINVALDASSELLQREVNSKDNEKLIGTFIKDVKK